MFTISTSGSEIMLSHSSDGSYNCLWVQKLPTIAIMSFPDYSLSLLFAQISVLFNPAMLRALWFGHPS
jgi:hypothetical protein